MRTIDIATCCLAGLLAAGCDPDPDPGSPDAGEVGVDAGPPPAERGVQSCAEIKALNSSATEGAQRIYLGGDKMKPVNVYCDGMDPGEEPKEYLELRQIVEGAPANVSIVYLNNHQETAMQQVLHTQFRRVRLLMTPEGEATSVAIDIGDTTHADRTVAPAGGMINFPLLAGTAPIEKAAFGVAVLCRSAAGGALPTVHPRATVDLGGTPFHLATTHGPVFMKTAESASADPIPPTAPTAATLTPYDTHEVGCNFVAPSQLRWPIINPSPGGAGILPLTYVPGGPLM